MIVTACERHPASELAEHEGAATDAIPAEVPSNPAGAAPVAAPKTEKPEGAAPAAEAGKAPAYFPPAK